MASLTFFRIKPGFAKPEDIVPERDSLRVEPVAIGGTLVGLLHLRRVERTKPSWRTYFDGASVDLSGFSFKTSSVSALLLVKQPDAYYAVVFGYGASLLADGCVDERFGLRTTLNGVEPSQLRSIDHKRLEAISRHTRENLSKAGTLGQFGVDVNRDLLRAVTGKPTDDTYGKRLSGADQLIVAANVPLKDLKAALTRYYSLSQETTYKKSFPWVDNIKDIHDPALKAQLDKVLAKQLKKGQ